MGNQIRTTILLAVMTALILWIGRALDKLGRYSTKLLMDANPSTAHMFIVNP